MANFDGNAHVLRLVTKLQYIRDIYGLNLTYVTLASFKYVFVMSFYFAEINFEESDFPYR